MARFDVFISHASEDKLEVARPLASLLLQAGLTVWLDETELVIGDSLRRKIDQGLASSRHGVVILSKAFFAKEWPKKELDALVARENDSTNVILPVWHNISAKDIVTFSPILADRLGARTDRGLHSVATSILQAVKRFGKSTSIDSDSAVGASNPRGHVGPKRTDQLMVEFIDRVAEVTEFNDEVIGVRTGLFDLDRLLGGLSPGELYVLGSRPSMGNTTVAVAVAAHVAISEGLPSLYFSLQARNQEMLNRLIASTGRIDRRGLTAGQLSDDEWKRLADAVDSVHNSPMYIDDSSPITIDEVLRRSKDVKEEAGAIGLLVVDSLEMLADDGQPDGGGTAVRKLGLLARELNCPVLLLAAVSRMAETRIDKRPMLSDLIAGEAIERNASVVVLLYRDDFYNRDSPSPGVIELIVARNRAGTTATVKLAFMKAIGRVENLAYPSTPSK